MLTARDLLQAILDGKTIVHESGRVLRLNANGNISHGGDGFDLTVPEWWKIKPEVILINGIEVPKPESIAPAEDTKYYYPVVGYTGGCEAYNESLWTNYDVDIATLNLGLVHLTKEAAIQHAQALLSFTRNTNV